MDLHDYQDVAENYDRYLEVMYKTEDHYEHFLEFYLDLARQYGQGGAVDIACGTGAVLLYLAENGVEVDGTDLSEAMCRVAAQKAEARGLKLSITPADMTAFAPGRTYSLAIIARSGFMHLPDPALQRAALLNIARLLAPRGILTLNTFDPLPFVQAAQMASSPEDYKFRLEYVNREGRREKIYNAITYDPVTQIMRGNWKFETYDATGEVAGTRIRPLTMRQTYRQEFRWLAELCGFEVLDVYKDYKSTPADEQPSPLIWVLRKR